MPRSRQGQVAAVAALAAAACLLAPAAAVSAPPRVLHLVDRSRTIRLPEGRRVPRPVTTELWYPPSGHGPWPLVVFGHGYALNPAAYRRLLAAWARAGFLVAAPVFPLGRAGAPGGPDESDIVNQPADLSFVISRLLAANASPASPLHGLIEPSRVAVAGHSDGAETAFADAYQRPWRDRRIRAALVFSGAVLGRYPVAPAPVPLLAVQGDADPINAPANTFRLFDAVGRPKFLLLLRHAKHLEPYTVPGPALAAVERVSIAFLRRYLDGAPARAIARAAKASRGAATFRSEP